MRSSDQPSNGLAKTAYEAIKREIIRCRLEPGLRVTKAQLVDRYGLGEAAVRDALSRLSQEQLVEVIPREGYVIAPVTLRQVQELFETRLVIEPAVARLAAGKIDGVELRRLDEAQRSYFDRADRDGLEAYVSANTAFHVAIAQGSGNRRLAGVIVGLLDEMERVMLLSYLVGDRRSARGQDPTHGELVDALIAGDGERAAAVMTTQLERNRRFVLEALMSTPSLQAVNLSPIPLRMESAR